MSYWPDKTERGFGGLKVHGDMLQHDTGAQRIEQPMERGYGGVVVREGVVVGPGREGRLIVRAGIVRLIANQD